MMEFENIIKCKGHEGRHEAGFCEICKTNHTITFELLQRDFITKQRVKEVIEKHHDDMLCANDDESADCCRDSQKKSMILDRILKDLNLEE